MMPHAFLVWGWTVYLALHSGPYGAHATSTELHALNHERARVRAPK
jgi:hypothetical protein